MSRYETVWAKICRTLLLEEIDPDTGTPFLIKELTLRNKKYIFSPKQSEFISDLSGKRSKFILFSGGRGCGKSLALCVKMYLIAKGFPGIRILLGRRHLADIERTTLQDFFKLVPPTEYEYRVKDGLINFKNGSQIVLIGLDAMQSSASESDLKKAEQKTKSLNLGAYFLDQLEEIEYVVFQKLNDTMRMVSPEVSAKFIDLTPEERALAQEMSPKELWEKYQVVDYPRQGSMTTNPANFWAYHYFKLGERMNEDGNWVPKQHPDCKLLEGSMLDNKDNLPSDFIRDRLNLPDSERRRMVYGEWNMDVLTKGAVFAKENLRILETMVKPPLRTEEGCEIYEEPRDGVEYRMGVDPSEGVVDPSSISVVSSEGRKVAKFNGMIPIQALSDKVKFLYYKYKRPLIIPESNAAGAALIREIRDLKVYRRKNTDEKWDKETEKLGFRMSWESKSKLIDHFQKLLRNRVPKIYDRKTIEEMKVFIWKDQASEQGASAQKGFHDDDIMSTMLAYWDFTPERVEEIRAIQARPIAKRRFQYN